MSVAPYCPATALLVTEGNLMVSTPIPLADAIVTSTPPNPTTLTRRAIILEDEVNLDHFFL